MLKLFEICFYTGILFSVVTFILGHFLNIAHLDALDFHMDLTDVTYFPLRPIILAAFSVVFGGIGIMMLNAGNSNLLSFIVSFASGILISHSINRFILIPLYKAQNTSSKSQKEIIGTKARVLLGMNGDKFGEIQYVVCGNTYSAPAKSIDGSERNKDTEVIILKIIDDVFYVGDCIDGEEEKNMDIGKPTIAIKEK